MIFLDARQWVRWLLGREPSFETCFICGAPMPMPDAEGAPGWFIPGRGVAHEACCESEDE